MTKKGALTTDKQESRPLITTAGTCANFAGPIPGPSAVVELYELRSIINDLLGDLRPKEALIVRRYFGLEGEAHEHTLSEIGQQLRLSVERIRQIRDKALRMLRHPSRRKKLAAYVGIHGSEALARFIAAEDAAYWATVNAKYAAEHAARERAWEEQRQAREARQRLQQARCEAAQRAKVDEMLRRIGDEVGPCTKWQAQCRQDVAATLANLVNERSTKVCSEVALFSYFVGLARQYPTRLNRAYATWMRDVRDVAALGEITFTQGFMRDGSFMLYARGSDRCTWYLFDMPDGPRWVGYEDRSEATT